MYKSKKIAAVIPSYNVDTQIEKVIDTMPTFIDKLVVINDASTDKTKSIVKKKKLKNKKIVLIDHKINQGVGGAIASGYVWCRDNKIDVAVVMAGDGQMLPKDLPALLNPVVSGKVDYAKANRLFTGEAYHKIPKIRYFGNSLLSFLTKIASGYWHVMDSQSGYTAINSKMLKLISWNKMYKRYGQPNDLLVRLNVFNAVVQDVPLDPVYGVGEISGLKIQKVFLTIPLMLLNRFLWRLKEKYIIRDFHPLVIFYFFGLSATLLASAFFIRMIILWRVEGEIPKITFLAWMLTVIASIQFISFAMWFDMEYNKELKRII